MSSEKSTNVRSQNTQHKTPRNLPALATRALAAISTDLAAGFALRLFFKTPKRRPAKNEEKQILAAAQKIPLRFRGDALAAWKWGEGPRVLLVHGWGGSAAQMTGFVDPLLAAGYSVLAFDAPGHGESPGTVLTIPSFARIIEKASAGPIHAVIGHSFGGSSALYAGAHGLDVRRAVFLAPPSTPEPWFARFSEYLGLSNDVRARLRERVAEYVGETIEALSSKNLGPRFDTPTLVIHDRADREVAWATGEEVADSLPAGAIYTTEGLGHRRVLTDRSVIEKVITFFDSAGTEERHCRACGRTIHTKYELCAQCTLGDQLFHREDRWAA